MGGPATPLESDDVQSAVAAIKKRKKAPSGGDVAKNQGLLFPTISEKEEKGAL